MAVLLALVMESLAVAIGAPLGGAAGHGLTGSVIGVVGRDQKR
ncbi:hypothetical protein [Streptomyces odontomachi]|nr:hypothetical protein [Streptomyces sp. ODS25]